MNYITKKPILALITLIVTGFLPLANAQAGGNNFKKLPPVAPKLTEKYEWHDESGSHEVWLNPNVVADFSGEEPANSPVKQADPDAREVPAEARSVRLWVVGQGKNSRAVSSAALKASSNAKVSPVFHSGPGAGYPRMALHGNVIVIFREEWDESAILDWVKTQGLEVVQRLPVGTHTYIIKTGAGLEALETANRIFASGDVIAAYPDWWREHATR